MRKINFIIVLMFLGLASYRITQWFILKDMYDLSVGFMYLLWGTVIFMEDLKDRAFDLLEKYRKLCNGQSDLLRKQHKLIKEQRELIEIYSLTIKGKN